MPLPHLYNLSDVLYFSPVVVQMKSDSTRNWASGYLNSIRIVDDICLESFPCCWITCSPSPSNPIFSHPDSDSVRRYLFLPRDVDYGLASVVDFLYVCSSSFLRISFWMKLMGNVYYPSCIYPERRNMQDSSILQHFRMSDRFPQLVIRSPSSNAASQFGYGAVIECSAHSASREHITLLFIYFVWEPAWHLLL